MQLRFSLSEAVDIVCRLSIPRLHCVCLGLSAEPTAHQLKFSLSVAVDHRASNSSIFFAFFCLADLFFRFCKPLVASVDGGPSPTLRLLSPYFSTTPLLPE